MSTAKRKSDDYKALTDIAAARRERLFRAGLAALLMVLMVIGLMVYDRDDAPAPASTPDVGFDLPRPLTTPPAEPQLDLSSLVSRRHEDRAAEADGTSPTPTAEAAEGNELPFDRPETQTDLSSSHDAVPSEIVASEVAETVIVASDEAVPIETVTTATDVPALVAKPQAKPVAKPVATAAPRPATNRPSVTPSAQPRFQLHLGGFGNTIPAHTLQDELSRQDHAARVQTRIAVGPFPDRKAAAEVLDKLRRERALRGVIVTGPADSGFLVQVGVFTLSTNADTLRRDLIGAGYPVQAHARVVLGPYQTRADAEVVRGVLRDARGLDAEVVGLR